MYMQGCNYEQGRVFWSFHSSFAHHEQNPSPKSQYDLSSYMFSQRAFLPAGAQLLLVFPSEPGAS